MNVYTHPLLSFLWLTAIVVQLWTADIVLFRPTQFHHRFFGLLLIWDCVTSIALFVCSLLGAGWPYHYIYWIGGRAFFVLATIQTLICFRTLFGPYRVMPRKFFWQFFVSLGILTAAVAIAFTAFPSTHASTDAPLYTLERSCEFWLCGALWLISIFADEYGIPMATRSYGIVIGLMVRYSTSVIWAVAASHLQSFRPGGSAVVPMYGFKLTSDLVAAVIWLYFISKHELHASSVTEDDAGLLQRLLKSYRKRNDSFQITDDLA